MSKISSALTLRFQILSKLWGQACVIVFIGGLGVGRKYLSAGVSWKHQDIGLVPPGVSLNPVIILGIGDIDFYPAIMVGPDLSGQAYDFFPFFAVARHIDNCRRQFQFQFQFQFNRNSMTKKKGGA
jgi:hypothetical protein